MIMKTKKAVNTRRPRLIVYRAILSAARFLRFRQEEYACTLHYRRLNPAV
jgi:hypothetical protein